MIRSFVFIAAAALAVSFATPALATGGTSVRPYVGALAGYDRVEIGGVDDFGTASDVMYGLLAGVEADVAPMAFIGVEAEVNDSEASKTRFSGIEIVESILVPVTTRISAGREIFAGVRAGLRPAGTFSVYGLAGYSNFRVEARRAIGEPAGDPLITRGSTSLNGFRLGAGIEIPIGPLRLRGEYRHAEYESVEFAGMEVDTSRDQFVGAAVLGF